MGATRNSGQTAPRERWYGHRQPGGHSPRRAVNPWLCLRVNFPHSTSRPAVSQELTRSRDRRAPHGFPWFAPCTDSPVQGPGRLHHTVSLRCNREAAIPTAPARTCRHRVRVDQSPIICQRQLLFFNREQLEPYHIPFPENKRSEEKIQYFFK